MQSEYFEYLRARGSAKILLRRLFLKPVIRFFTGRVLDIGSGLGEFLEYYPDAVGVDIDKAAVSFCTGKGYRCFQADICRLPFGADEFDGVLLNNILEHIENPDEAFSEIKRVLKHGGRLMIELPGKKGYYYDKTHVKFWEKDEMVRLLERWGFQQIRTEYFPVPFRLAGDILTHNKLRLFAVNAKKDIVE